MANSVKASMGFEGLKPSVYAQKVGQCYLKGTISSQVALRPLKQSFTTLRPSSLTRRRCVRVSPIAQYSPLLPPVGVWAVSQSQCGRPPSQAGY
jgi:hypothetical protein